MRPIFCGNFEYDARQSELERLFKRYGRVERIDMKSGFAFIYMEDERDAEDAIRGLDRIEFGRKGRRLRVEWTKQERGARRLDSGGGGGSRRASNTRPSKTLFVINFDSQLTRTRDLERHFEPYGKIASVRIRRNFAFVQYEAQEDASKALEATNMSKLMDRVISVEYAVRDDDEKKDGGGYSPERTRDRSPRRRSHGRRRSPSPYKKGRSSPEYARESARSPYKRERAGSDQGRGGGSRSPAYRRERGKTDNGRGRSPSPYERDAAAEADNGNGMDSSPYEREKGEVKNGRGSSYERDGGSPSNGRRASPAEERDSPNDGRADSPPMRDRFKR
ncbi:unnamed protein product [Linum tenue]|uniref:RRM domain-containing protein n=1 Tax=Linum tenue TaxID=586396 RepID=A0AAV0IM05_9ROSI|nr:unnamed protein product [Linum tenue]